MALSTVDSLANTLASFKATLEADVKSLIDLHEKDSGGVGRPGKWLEAVTRSSVVLLAANLENFIETTICEGLKVLVTHKVVARRYPENLRLWIFRQEINMRSLGLQDARDVTELSMRLWSDVRELSEDELKLEQLREDFANPTPKNVDWLMSLLDYSDYLADVTVIVDGEAIAGKSGLGQLAKRRNEIAHGNVNEKPSIADVKKLAKFSQLFANKFKKDTEQVILQCLPKK